MHLNMGALKRAELQDININTGAQSNNSERDLLSSLPPLNVEMKSSSQEQH